MYCVKGLKWIPTLYVFKIIIVVFIEMSNGLGLTALPREKAWKICQSYLQGAWTNIDQDEIIVKQIT